MDISEKAARELCKIRGQDADEKVKDMQGDYLGISSRWIVVSREIDQHREVAQAIALAQSVRTELKEGLKLTIEEYFNSDRDLFEAEYTIVKTQAESNYPGNLLPKKEDPARDVPAPQQSSCTCPSGDGSLRWPCPVQASEPVETLPAADAAPLQQLADQAQELDMGYGPNACQTCGKTQRAADAAQQQQVECWTRFIDTDEEFIDLMSAWRHADKGDAARKAFDDVHAYVTRAAAPPAPQKPVAWRWKLGEDELHGQLHNDWRFSSVPLAQFRDRVIEALYGEPAPQQAESQTLREKFDKVFLSTNGFHTKAELTLEWDKGLSGVLFRAGAAAQPDAAEVCKQALLALREVTHSLEYLDTAYPEAAGKWDRSKTIERARAIIAAEGMS